MDSISILDSAMGSELISRGEKLPKYIWSAHSNLNNPNLVYKIHRDNVLSGACIIIANTFRTTPRAYKKTGLTVEHAVNESNKSLNAAILLAKKAASNNVMILGSVAPLEDCYHPELFPGEHIAMKEYYQLGKWIQDAGADGIILETMNSVIETKTALLALKNINLPIYVSFYLIDSLHLASGELINSALCMLEEFAIEAVLLNCIPINIATMAVENLVNNWEGSWGAYPNLGKGKPSSDGVINNICSDKIFLSLMDKIIFLGGHILGGCCGSSPHHISLLHSLYKNIN